MSTIGDAAERPTLIAMVLEAAWRAKKRFF